MSGKIMVANPFSGTKQTGSFRIDLHVHTAFGSACAELHDPDTLPDSMEKHGLDGVVVTEHNLLWPGEKIIGINRRLPKHRRLYRGIEVSTSQCHVVVIGLDSFQGIYPGMPPERLIEHAEKEQAVTILVHPCLNGLDLGCNGPWGFHGMEVASTMTRGDFRRKTLVLCRQHHTLPVAGSDAHCSENLGKAFTCFPFLPVDEKELALMIRQGLGVPMVIEPGGEARVVC